MIGVWDVWFGCVLYGGVFQGVVGKVVLSLFLCQFCMHQVVSEIFVSLIRYNWRFCP